MYRKESEHEGRPVLKKAKETGSKYQQCRYHFEAKAAWRLGSRHRPDEDRCVSHIAAPPPDGRLPPGARPWRSHPRPAPPAPHTA